MRFLNIINKNLDRTALIITASVGSMWCAIAFTILSLISLPAAISTKNPIVIVGWIAQTFLQLVLLPIIIVGQNLQAQKHDEHAAKLDAITDHLGITNDKENK